MNTRIDYEKIVSDIHFGKYQIKAIKFSDPAAKTILEDYISNVPEEVDAMVENAKNHGYTFSELMSLVAQSGVKKGLSLN